MNKTLDKSSPYGDDILICAAWHADLSRRVGRFTVNEWETPIGRITMIISIAKGRHLGHRTDWRVDGRRIGAAKLQALWNAS